MTFKVKREELIKKIEAAKAEAIARAKAFRDEAVKQDQAKKAKAQKEHEADVQTDIQTLEQVLKALKAGKPVPNGRHYVSLESNGQPFSWPDQKPLTPEQEKEIAKKYDHAITLLKMVQDEMIEISDRKDKWGLSDVLGDIF